MIFFQIFKNITRKRPPRGPENMCQTSASLFKFLLKIVRVKATLSKMPMSQKYGGVKSSNFGFIFEARTKSPHDVREKCIFLDIMRGFYPKF